MTLIEKADPLMLLGKSKPPDQRLSERMARAVARQTALPPAPLSWTRRVERAVRQGVFRQGALMLADGERFVVVVKDISSTGARVEFFAHRDLPNSVILVEPTLQIKSRARVVWQEAGAAGLAFVAE